jgi:hypothetical protein
MACIRRHGLAGLGHVFSSRRTIGGGGGGLPDLPGPVSLRTATGAASCRSAATSSTGPASPTGSWRATTHARCAGVNCSGPLLLNTWSSVIDLMGRHFLN